MSSIVISGDSSGTVSIAAPAIAGTNTMTLVAGTGTLAPTVLSTAVASTSGTSIDFTNIPPWVTRITIMFNSVSSNGGSLMQIQLGTSSGIQNTGYASGAFTPNTNNSTSSTGMLIIGFWSSGYSMVGHAVLTLLDAATGLWVCSSVLGGAGGNSAFGGGSKTLSGVLDRVRITTVNGTDTFDAGSVNIMYE